MVEAEWNPSISTFVVRFWRDTAPGEDGEGRRWYGQVEHVQSGERRAFHDLEQMLRFMQECAGMGAALTDNCPPQP